MNAIKLIQGLTLLLFQQSALRRLLKVKASTNGNEKEEEKPGRRRSQEKGRRINHIRE